MTRSATYTKGDVIIVEGSHTSEVYALTRGSVEVYRQGPPERRRAVLSSPSVFGEMAVSTEHPRPASVRALEDIEVSNATSPKMLGEQSTASRRSGGPWTSGARLPTPYLR